MGYSPWGCKELDSTQGLRMHSRDPRYTESKSSVSQDSQVICIHSHVCRALPLASLAQERVPALVT